MSITIKQVRELREMSGAGMLDCKTALAECSGNMEEAVIYLQKKGLADAQKRRGRATNIGRIFITHNKERAVILELLCETDFVARNDTFVALGNDLANALIGTASEEERARAADTLVKRGGGIIKENIRLNRHCVMALGEGARVSSYIHGDDGSLGALVVAKVAGDPAEVDVALHDVALHVSACRPLYLDRESVPEEYRAQQMRIFVEQAKDSGKPEHIVEKIASGKLNKHFGEICLLEQKFVKDDKKSVRQVLGERVKEPGQDVRVASFACYKAGEAE